MASHSWLTCTFWALAAAVSAYTPVATLPACTRRAPGYTCGKAGSLAAPKPLSVTTNVQNIDSCRIQCLQEQSYDGCLSFGYDANRKQCSTFAATLASMRFTASASSSTTYYAYGCFKCLDKCPQSTEPLVYPGFEQAMSSSGPLSPWVGAQVISPGHNSKRAAYDQSYFEISQKIVTCPGQLYEVTFDYMISYYSPSAHHLRVRVGDLTSENYIYTNSNNNTWRTFRSSFQPIYYEDPTQLTISMDSNADGFVERRKSKFWVDNVRVTPSTAPLSAAAGAPELVKNGGFENRAVEPFNVTGSPQPAGKANITFVAPGFEGSRYAVQYNPIGDPNRSSSITLEQTLQLDYNIEYIYSFMYKIAADTGGQCAQGYSPSIYTTVGNNLLASGQQDSFSGPNNQVTSAAVGSWVLFQRRVTGKDSFGYGSGTPIRIRIVNDAPPRCPLLTDNVSLRRRA